MENFFDINDDLSGFDESTLEQALEGRTYTEICQKCRGRGTFVSYSGRTVGTCYACKGAGKFERKTSPEARAKAKQSRVNRVEAEKKSNWASFAEANVAEAAWIEANAESFEFARSLFVSVAKYGSLTDGQRAAVQRCIDKQVARVADRVQREASAVVVDIARINTALESAKANQINNPKLRLGDFTFSLAKVTSVNAGAVYVKEGELYLGKVVAGKFTRSRDCSAEQEAAIIAACADPEAAAVAYGKRTGVCSCCGRQLTNGESIDRGIGPICATKFGW
jgi:hypothetical protein